MPEQLTMDLPELDAVEMQWQRNEAAQRAFWTPERVAAAWYFGYIDGLAEFERLPGYRQRYILDLYDTEATIAGMFRKQMRPAWCAEAEVQRGADETQRHAEEWAAILREDFKQGRPCSIKPTPEFRHVLDLALHLISIPRSCLGLTEDLKTV